MASSGRVKAVARRVNEWVSQTAASASRRLVVPSPVPSPDMDQCEEERERADSNELADDASGRRSPEYGTGGLNDNVTITDEEAEEQIEEQ